MPTTLVLDALDPDLIPPDGELVEVRMTWNPVPSDEPETRTFSFLEIMPADDKLSKDICGVGVMGSLAIGAPTSLMVMWFVAGRQGGLRKEPHKRLDHLFTMRALGRMTYEVEVEIPDEPEPDEDANPLDKFDLGRDDEDPTPASTT